MCLLQTFTLTGSPDKYQERGLIPRSISMLFNEFRNRPDMEFTIKISYLEIYNDQGYDLLRSDSEFKLDPSKKVAMLEDDYGNVHMKDLSLNPANSEEEALNLLFVGDTNREVAATPMNLASSRSHCIFTVALEAKAIGSEKVRRSKLHLVDLAGSERVAKTNSSGTTLTEAKHINSSLFFLEQVIVALHEKATKGRDHIPYRNSMMTSVLRDSLGGNCKTIMIATINPETSHTEESLSTCRFAQRVSLIKNKASINEEQDPTQVIKKLKVEVVSLREQMAFLKGESGEGAVLSDADKDTLREQCMQYCYDADPRAILNIGTLTLNKIKEGFLIMKSFVQEAAAAAKHSNVDKSQDTGIPSTSNGSSTSAGSARPEEVEKLLKQVRDLKSMLQQRDSEIAILVNMVKQGKTERDVQEVQRPGSSLSTSSSFTRESVSDRPSLESSAKSSAQAQKEREERLVQRHLFGVPPPPDPAIFEDAAASFEWFRDRCSLNQSLNDNKDQLRERISEAKTMGDRAQNNKTTINYLKNTIEAIRRERAMKRLNSGDEEELGEEEMEVENSHRRAIEIEKKSYQESCDRLRVLKPEIEHIRKLLEKCQLNMQTQFDQWYSQLHTKSGVAMVQRAVQDTHSSVQSLLNSSVPSASYDSSSGSSRYREHKVTHVAEAKPMASAAVAPAKFQDDVYDDIAAFNQAKEELLKRNRQY